MLSLKTLRIQKTKPKNLRKINWAEELPQIVKRIQKGETIKSISESLNVHPATVHEGLRKRGLSSRVLKEEAFINDKRLKTLTERVIALEIENSKLRKNKI